MKYALCAGALACAAIVAAHTAGQVPAGDPLDALERALEAQPDDLKTGNDYRMAVIQVNQLKVYDRAIACFDKLVAANPTAANAHLNYGFAYVDKIPAAGSITQVILANNALGEFTKSLELKPSWIAYYTRGNSYLFWPRIFNRTHLGVADLQEALKMQQAGPKHFYYARVYVALGDGYWKMDNTDDATKTWRAGLAEFPDNAALKARLAAQPDALKTLIDEAYDSNKRVDTSLKDLWASQ
jgi:tetratricopeptide (TPR) repeat protein